MFRKYMLSAVLVVAASLVTGCSSQDLSRFGYQLGAQHACMQENTAQTHKSVKDLECMSGATTAEIPYDEFERARREELGQ